MKNIVLNKDTTKIKALQPLHILLNHDYNFIKKNNIQVWNMKSVSANSTHTQNITTFQITEEDIGINLKKHFNIFSQKNVVNVALVKKNRYNIHEIL